MQFKGWLFESFDTVSDFILNPEHRNKTFDELLDEFKKSGGEILGSGKYGIVFDHPRWNYVLKLYTDEFYTGFVRFAYKHPHPAFPKFYGLPQKVLPFYKRHKSVTFQYLVRVEKLKPISNELFLDIDRYLHFGTQYAEDRSFLDQYITSQHKALRDQGEGFKKALREHPKLLNLFDGWNILMKSGLKGSPDVSIGNFMMRDNGDIVITDPFWGGSNPYADHQRAIDMETDRYGSEIPEEPDVEGGKFPKKKRVKKPKPFSPPQQKFGVDELPF